MYLLSMLAVVGVGDHMAAHIIGAESLVVWSCEFESSSGLHIYPYLLMTLYQFNLIDFIAEWNQAKSHIFHNRIQYETCEYVRTGTIS
jgi:hypothetical protein